MVSSIFSSSSESENEDTNHREALNGNSELKGLHDLDIVYSNKYYKIL